MPRFVRRGFRGECCEAFLSAPVRQRQDSIVQTVLRNVDAKLERSAETRNLSERGDDPIIDNAAVLALICQEPLDTGFFAFGRQPSVNGLSDVANIDEGLEACLKRV